MPPAERGGRAAGWVASLVAVAALLALPGCTEDPILGIDPDDGPGASPATVEARLDVTDLPAWRDTTLVGFAVAAEAPFALLAELPDLGARVLARVPVRDVAFSGEDTLEIQRFVSGAVSFRVDTARSLIPSLPLTVHLFALERGFDRREASWEAAAPDEPWATAGGDLGPLLASGELEAEADSVRLPLAGADTLLEMWRQGGGEPGFALVLDDAEARLRITQLRLSYQAEVEEREDPIPQAVTADPWLFIYDPAQPEPGVSLRVGGIPAARAYITFRPPELVAGVPLRGSTVNKAALHLYPLAPPPPPFVLEREVTGRPVRLAADPFEFLQKTPIGAVVSRIVSFQPDSLAQGQPIRIDVTDLMQGYANREEEGEDLRIGIRTEPDGATFGFWEFGSVEAAEEFRPELRIILTPPAEFGNP